MDVESRQPGSWKRILDEVKGIVERFPLDPPRLGPYAKWVAISVALVGLLLMGGGAYAAHNLAGDYEGRLLPGTSIAGVDVSGLTPKRALKAVRTEMRPELNRPVTLEWKKRQWKVTPRDVGATTNARALVKAAREASKQASFFDQAQMALFGGLVGFDEDVEVTYPRRGVRKYVTKLAARSKIPARDAQIDASTGWVEIKPEREGRTLMVDRTSRELLQTFRSGGEVVDVPVKPLKPEVTAGSFDKILLLRIGENKLYMYDDGRITNQWTVATGQPEYPTPTGIYEVTLKRFMPTWINPDPTGWGASMPATIGPGIHNPLGTRALNWSASGIRFHGTTATYSLGHNASHGCVRMSIEDSEQLYELVDVGTPIVSIQAGDYKPLYDSSVDPGVGG